MTALTILAAAAAAQAATQTGAPPAQTAPQSAPADSQRKPGETNYLDIEGGLGYSSNPLLEFGSDTGAGFGRISLHAVHARVSERSTTLLSAYAQNVTYFSRHGSDQSLSLSGRHDTAVSEHVRLFVDASGSYDKGGQLDTRIIGLPEVPPPPGTSGQPPILLPAPSDFLAITGRTYTVAAHGGATVALSPRDDLSFSAGAEHVAFRGFQDSDYTTIPATLAYDRQLSPRTTVGARVVFQSTNYKGPANFRLVTPQLTARLVLSERVTFDGAIGASFATVDDGIRTTHTTGLAAEGDLCLRGEHSHLCARAATNEQTATVAGPARTVSGGIDYSRTLSPDSTIAFSAGIDHFSSPISVLSGQTFSTSTYYRAAADYSRRIGHRWFGGINLAARKLAEHGPDPNGDVSASLFIRYRFGDLG
jgi:hypothetical protein